MAWKSVDLPTLARPTLGEISIEFKVSEVGILLTMPLFKLLPGRPKRIFSSLTAFLGGILFFFEVAYDLVEFVVEEVPWSNCKVKEKTQRRGAEPAAGRFNGTKKEDRIPRVATEEFVVICW